MAIMGDHAQMLGSFPLQAQEDVWGENPDAVMSASFDPKGVATPVDGGYRFSGTFGFSSGIDAGIGFDAITVALLGRSTPVGVLVAGILFGAFKAGGFAMQAANGVPIDIVLVVQSLIVLFIAAPPLVRAIFRLPAPGARQPKVRAAKKKEAAR